ncbi:MAG: beta-glucosidase [Clostridiales bacterium]|nr:beta-glucosidase [Clostridiales bacterium]
MGFSKDFIWGTATASYQIEGAYNEDGKGLNCWDVYAGIGNHIKYNETGNVACDHYHHMKEDVALMKELGTKAYRFSISWTRILPDGIGKVNEKGIKFYSDLIDELIANGIEPMITLYHWDYPFELHRKGGWMNDDSSEWFLEYTKIVVDNFSDRVSYWITINEPQCELGCGFLDGVHSPFEKHISKDLLIMGRNMLLSHGKAADYIRKNAKKPAKIGFSPIGPCALPSDNSPEAIEEARIKTFSSNGDRFPYSISYWSDPIFLRKYPEDLIENFGDLVPAFSEEEWDLVSTPLDFYGTNIYYANESRKEGVYSDIYFQGKMTTNIGWPLTPEVLYWAPKFYYERYGKPVMITENGMASHDWVCLDGKVHDSYRIDYLHRYLREYKRAADDGVELIGYMQWSLMDNYEWSHGYTQRFGLVYVDYPTQKRTIKDSGYWYKKVIETNGEEL